MYTSLLCPWLLCFIFGYYSKTIIKKWLSFSVFTKINNISLYRYTTGTSSSWVWRKVSWTTLLVITDSIEVFEVCLRCVRGGRGSGTDSFITSMIFSLDTLKVRIRSFLEYRRQESEVHGCGVLLRVRRRSSYSLICLIESVIDCGWWSGSSCRTW